MPGGVPWVVEAMEGVSMFARFTRFYLDAADEDRFREVGMRFLPMLREQPGCRSVVWVQAEGESSVFSTWDSRENAEAVTSAVRDKAVSALQEASIVLAGGPETTIYEVVETP
jgi:heme-degrading monooxygenase HmoA